MSFRLAELTSPTVRAPASVLVPVGSVEQHGPHLPLDTDTVVAVEVALAAADRVRGDKASQVLVAPPVAYGSSGEHQSFAGTSSIGTEALTSVIVELVRSMSAWCGRVVFVNGHGGNVDALALGVTQLRSEGHDVAWVPCAVDGADAHAGHFETSLMLHLRPRAVRMSLTEVGNMTRLDEVMPVLRRTGVAAVSPNGVLGDPRFATAESGREMFASMVGSVSDLLSSGVPDLLGRLRPPSDGLSP